MMKHNVLLTMGAAALLFMAAGCQPKDARTAFYGTWKMREVVTAQGRLNFDYPDSFITHVAHQALDARLQAQYRGDGEYAELTAADTAEALEDASNLVNFSLMNFYLQFRFEEPDRVTMSVFLRTPVDNTYAEADSKTGTFEVKPEESLLVMKGVNLKDSTKENRWKYSFLTPERLRLTAAEAEDQSAKGMEFVFHKVP